MPQPRGRLLRGPSETLRRTDPWGTQWGQLDGLSDDFSLTGAVQSRAGRGTLTGAAPLPCNKTSTPFGGQGLGGLGLSLADGPHPGRAR